MKNFQSGIFALSVITQNISKSISPNHCCPDMVLVFYYPRVLSSYSHMGPFCFPNKNKWQQRLVRIQGKGNPHSLLVGLQTDTLTMVITMWSSQKANNRVSTWPSYATVWNLTYDYRNWYLLHRHFLRHVHCHFIHNS